VTEALDLGHGQGVERNARAIITLLPLLLTTSACIVELGDLGEEETDSDTTEGDGASGNIDPTGDTGDTGDTDGTDTDVPPVPSQRAVDILFVVDNSGSMSEEQAKLAASIDTLVATLDSAVVPVDYRIGVTTTDNGNPWCGTTSPEGGSLRATSCRSRPVEFTFNGSTVIEGFDTACAEICPEGLMNLGIDDGMPWIDVQRSLGTTNVGDAVVDNLRCMLPQGIDGCGFESQLESTYKSVQRFDTLGDQAFGFHREGALLAVMIVTDEVDCSHNPAADAIFLPDGNQVFWSDPSASAPTSAVCWNAGVSCTELGDGTLDCVPADYDVSGDPTTDPDAAVLHPVERYATALDQAGAYVSAIYGVGLDGSVVYQPSLADPQFGNDFGVAPGCESGSGRAVPPVRMRDVVTTLGGNSASICAEGFQGALSAFALGILARLPE
jgi:hypothetical protein